MDEKQKDYFIELGKQAIRNFKCDYDIQYYKFRHMQAYYTEILQVRANDGYVWDAIVFVSYRTPVAVLFPQNKLLIEYGKYSRTTSKQITVFENYMDVDTRILTNSI